MPVRYDYTASAYRVSCTRCSQSIVVDAVSREAIVIDGAAPATTRATDWIGWHAGHGRFVTRCRSCEREVRAARPARPRSTGTRVPGTFRALGAGRRFGVELELIFPRGTDRHTINSALTSAGLVGWAARTDGSLSGNGWEVVSPVLAGDDGIEQVRKATRALRGIGATVNRSCGMHVHHEIRDLTVDGIKQVFRTWRANQPLIDGLVAPSRRGRQTYCGDVTDAEMGQVEAARDIRSMENFYRFYSNLNLGAFGRFGTIEIRQHQGTNDPEKIVSWIKFGQAIIDRAAEQSAAGTTTATASSRVRDMLGQLGEHLDETARTFLLGRTVEFGAVAV